MRISNSRGFGFLLGDVTRHLRKAFDRRAARFGLTRAQWRTLAVVSRQEGISQCEVADAIEMEPIAVGRVVDRLQQAGFVERRPDPADRRRWSLHSTAKAKAVLDDMEVVAEAVRKDALRGIDRADFDGFVATLQKIKDNLSALDGAQG